METKTMKVYKKYIISKEDLYEATFRNGWVLPKSTSSIVTEEYLHTVAQGTTYCPKADDLKFK